MIPLVITGVCNVVCGCCKGNDTGLEDLSCENSWLIGNVCLSSEYPIGGEYALCCIQGLEVVLDRLSTVMRGAI